MEIRDPARDHKLITLIEILSPSGKHPGPDREAYEAKQREVLQSEASLIELDLLRRGRRIVPDRHVEAMLDRLEPPPPSYVILVNRAWQRSHAAARLPHVSDRPPRVAPVHLGAAEGA